MAEKRVSVRLSATGGRQVKDALRGVGEAGQQGFRRLSREMEAANRRLARFARQATRMARVVGAAAAAAGAALIRSGLQTIDAQAKLAQSLATTTASVQVLARAADLSGNSFRELEAGSARLTRRLSLFAADGSGPAADAIRRLGLNAAELLALPLDQRIARVTEAIRQNAAASEQAALFSQLFGDRAFVAFQRLDPAQLRQANDELRRFGVLVSDADADRIEETNDAISRLGLLWRGLSNQLAVAAAPALQSAAEGLARLGEVGGPIQRVFTGISDALVLLIDNVGRVASTAAAFAGFLAGRWVAGLAAAALSVRGLATALVVLRGALIRTGIGALIVGAGELIYQFTRLVSGAGGFGNAMALLGRLASEVWDRIGMGAASVGASAMATFADIHASAASAMQGALEAVVGFANAAVNSFEGAFEAIRAVWGLLPAAIGDMAFQAANSLIEGVEAMLNGVVTRINGFIEGVNAGLEALGVERRIGVIAELDIGRLENRFAGAATQAAMSARDAFASAFADNPLAVPDLGLTAAATEAAASAVAWRQTAATLADGALQPLAALDALRAAVSSTGTEAETALDGATVAAERFDAALSGDDGTGPAAALDETAEAAGRAGDAMQSAADVARQSWDAARAAVERTQEIAKGLAEDFTGPIKETLKSGRAQLAYL